MRDKPEALTVGATPQKLTTIKTIGEKVAIHVKTSSAEGLYVYLTGAIPEALDYGSYTHEMSLGSLYETPAEHVGEVWVASTGPSTLITATKYG